MGILNFLRPPPGSFVRMTVLHGEYSNNKLVLLLPSFFPSSFIKEADGCPPGGHRPPMGTSAKLPGLSAHSASPR